ncbi:MAG TPA: hypothetical protein VFB54_13600 [Burkholderiales bacterium]|nr:hypothetical protein [Burkholderiales bacterium]
MLHRRKKQFAAVAGTLFVIAWIVAWSLPAVYRSTATILIEQQEIPSELVRSTISSYADQRIQTISQQTMSRASLMHIVEKYRLYAVDKTGQATASMVERLRKNIKLELVKADITDLQSGNKTAATIAFTLSYDGDSADRAQKVANELVSLFIDANNKERQAQAAETSSFFGTEAAKLSGQIAGIEARLATFKTQNMGRLPEQVQLTLQQKERTEAEIREVERQLNALAERKLGLEAQLAQVKPNLPLVSATGERILDETERLKVLQSQYASLSGIYSKEHPDIVKLKSEIEALQSTVGAALDAEEQTKQLERLRGELTTIRERYSASHPDVVRLKESIKGLEASIAHAAPGRVRNLPPENPAYITLQSQLEATQGEIKSLRNKNVELKASIRNLEARLLEAPRVEREYLDLTRERETSLRRYEDIREKQMRAQVAQQLEHDAKGERFSVLDPAQLPDHPYSPNRLAIVFLGLVLSLGAGAGYAAIREALDDRVHSRSALASVTDVPLLALIPPIDAERGEHEGRKLRRFGSAFALLAASLCVFLGNGTPPIDEPGCCSTHAVEVRTDWTTSHMRKAWA